MARSVGDEHLSLEILNCTAEALKSSVARRKVTETWGWLAPKTIARPCGLPSVRQ